MTKKKDITSFKEMIEKNQVAICKCMGLKPEEIKPKSGFILKSKDIDIETKKSHERDFETIKAAMIKTFSSEIERSPDFGIDVGEVLIDELTKLKGVERAEILKIDTKLAKWVKELKEIE